MGDLRGFLKVDRTDPAYRPVCERLKDYHEVIMPRSDEFSEDQASRCMDCGTPTCHWGCPIGNYIPEWNDLVFHKKWKRAMELLRATNNLPEVTGRICPALCEYACVLGINDDPITIRENELAIIEHSFRRGYIKPNPTKKRTGKKVAVVGSGPAGLAAADQLNRAGHKVTVFEKDDKPGGILRYGIPDFKLEKRIIDRRVDLLKKEGIEFITGAEVAGDGLVDKLSKEYDAICLTGGCRTPRDLKIEGRDLKGIHFAMDYLTQSNRRVAGVEIRPEDLIDARGKRVVIIGGGDTGADCVGTANRQGASCVVQIEVLPKPPECRTNDYPWPKYPLLLKTTSSHEEGAERHWAITTKRFTGEKGFVKKLFCAKIQFVRDEVKGCPVMKEIAGSEFEIDADLAILAIGFTNPEHKGLVSDLKVALDERGNVKTNSRMMTSVEKVFAAGDMRRGQSLVVWAISEGRRAAHFIDEYLEGKSILPLM